MSQENNICYLCGKLLNKDDKISRDHVPPKQFYASGLRQKHNLNLFTLPVHFHCNKSYQKDEDYFVHSIAPLAKGSYAGNAIWEDIAHKFERPQGQRIGKMILKEFDNRPSGLVLPFGKVVKRFDPDRIWRVVWKIVRGLFYKENGIFLPVDTPKYFMNVSVGDHPPVEFEAVRNTPSKGEYPGIFAYKHIQVAEIDNFNLWAMLFWNRLIKIVGFHHPDCKCDKCNDDALSFE